jgi:hypothetical protein
MLLLLNIPREQQTQTHACGTSIGQPENTNGADSNAPETQIGFYYR